MITEAGPLNLRSGPAGLTCKVHPSVLVTICDSYIRRPSGARRVIGTLLGYAIEDSVYVKACYTEISEEDEAQVRRSLALLPQKSWQDTPLYNTACTPLSYTSR